MEVHIQEISMLYPYGYRFVQIQREGESSNIVDVSPVMHEFYIFPFPLNLYLLNPDSQIYPSALMVYYMLFS